MLPPIPVHAPILPPSFVPFPELEKQKSKVNFRLGAEDEEDQPVLIPQVGVYSISNCLTGFRMMIYPSIIHLIITSPVR